MLSVHTKTQSEHSQIPPFLNPSVAMQTNPKREAKGNKKKTLKFYDRANEWHGIVSDESNHLSRDIIHENDTISHENAKPAFSNSSVLKTSVFKSFRRNADEPQEGRKKKQKKTLKFYDMQTEWHGIVSDESNHLSRDIYIYENDTISCFCL